MLGDRKRDSRCSRLTTVADGAGGFLIKAYLQWYGFGHDAEYWSNVGALEAEAWAQFGRVYFDNDSNVTEILV